MEMEEQAEEKEKKSRKKKKKREDSVEEIFRVSSEELAGVETLQGEESQEVLEVEKKPPQIPTAAYGEEKRKLQREEEKEISDEEKSKPLLRGSMRSLRMLRRGGHKIRKSNQKEPEVPEFQRLKCLNPCCAALCRFWRFITKERNFTPREKKCIVALVTSVLAAIVFLGLFPSSFVYLDYHDYALKYDKVTGAVDRTTTYDFGCYILGPSTAFLTFSRSANIISKSHDVFTSDKITIKITYHTQYFLRKSEIGTLHLEFDTGYDSEKLEGNCCQSCCPSSCTNNTVCSSCLGPGSCDQGYHITVGYFQLTTVDIPQEVLERYLQSILLMEYAETEELKQAKAVEDKITLRQTSLVYNEANEIVETGNAESQKIRIISEADREANLTTAYVSALSSMYTTLNVVQEDHKLSLMMLRVLEEAAVKGKLYRSYGYENETIYNRPLALPAG
uniref:Uncharacterized protein LOC111124415 n=1 Tax=Crassostrea virginica TaxID=6565 RepID=A0A8B8D5N8_CRAVI|nr:uncharacterized protein LOC111124415 [Crassostrea virginica]